MRAVLMLVITWMVLSPEIVTKAQAAPARANRVSVSYVPPKNPAHQPIYDQLREVRFLEKLQQFLTPFRLPRALLVKVEGCDGDANAFYENNVITICYEYIELLRKTMPAETTAAGVTPTDAIVGPLFDTSLHEFAHALFEMLRLPVLGREEDAADQVSAYIMLQFGKVEARRLIGGVAYAYKTEADAATAPSTMTNFADLHRREGIFAEGTGRGLRKRIPAGCLCVRKTDRPACRPWPCKKSVRQELAAPDGPIGPSH